jgi:hypothetical protein
VSGDAGVDRLGALEVQDHRERALVATAVQRGDVGGHYDRAVARRRQRVRPADRAGGEGRRLRVVDRAGIGHLPRRPVDDHLGRGRWCVDREQAAGEPARAGTGKVEVALGQAGEEVRGRAAVGLQLAERVVVTVEDGRHV